MLILIGLGMDVKDISVRALEELKKADSIYLEQYTTFISQEYIDYLKQQVPGKQIVTVGRSEMEEDAKQTMKDAQNTNVVILVPGDPLIATTHHATLIDTATKMGIKYKVYHAPSIYSAAIGESGLDVYRFGSTVTIAFWSEKYKPTSFLDVINRNIINDEHSLILLDLDQEEKRTMRLGEAINLLEKAEAEAKFGIIDDSVKILVMADIGKPSQQITYTTIGEAKADLESFSGKMLSIIVPATPSFAEQDALTKFVRPLK